MAGARWRAWRAAALAAPLLMGGCAGGGLDAQLVAPERAPSTTTTAPLDPTLVELMDGAGMTPPARRLFLAASPRIEDKVTLSRSCTGLFAGNEPGSVHTYGCVVDGKVHLRAFGHPEMHDFRYVVAAHELLHLVYARLPSADRARLDAQLHAARAGNELLEERLRIYSAAAGDTLNEVHSLLGTEFPDLPAELEVHFGRYIDRGRVLAAYERTLGSRQRELRRLKTAIERTGARLEEMNVRLDALRATGPASAYNAGVAEYNALVREHNASVAEAGRLADEYNGLTDS